MEDDNGHIDIKKRADEAIQQVMRRFPSVVGYLLHGTEVDTTGRSFLRDWATVADVASTRSKQLARTWHAAAKDPVILSATLQTCDLVIRIFAQQNAKLWEGDVVLQWMYDNLVKVQSSSDDELPLPPSPAIMRYAGADPADYDNKVVTMPPDANIINPELVARAMAVVPNLPRFLRGQARPRGGGPFNEELDGGGVVFDADGIAIRQLQRQFLGPPTQVVDPDWPMAEVFWRSFLPWNRVDGIAPPR